MSAGLSSILYIPPAREDLFTLGSAGSGDAY